VPKDLFFSMLSGAEDAKCRGQHVLVDEDAGSVPCSPYSDPSSSASTKAPPSMTSSITNKEIFQSTTSSGPRLVLAGRC